jgi:hypothetical protein
MDLIAQVEWGVAMYQPIKDPERTMKTIVKRITTLGVADEWHGADSEL